MVVILRKVSLRVSLPLRLCSPVLLQRSLAIRRYWRHLWAQRPLQHSRLLPAYERASLPALASNWRRHDFFKALLHFLQIRLAAQQLQQAPLAWKQMQQLSLPRSENSQGATQKLARLSWRRKLQLLLALHLALPLHLLRRLMWRGERRRRRLQQPQLQPRARRLLGEL